MAELVKQKVNDYSLYINDYLTVLRVIAYFYKIVDILL